MWPKSYKINAVRCLSLNQRHLENYIFFKEHWTGNNVFKINFDVSIFYPEYVGANCTEEIYLQINKCVFFH